MISSSINSVNNGSAEEFISILTKEVKAHPAVNHEYLKRLSNGDFKDIYAALRDYAHQYSFYSMWFPEYISSVISSTKDKNIIDPLNHNLEEELGDEESNFIPHTKLFANFKSSIGIDEKYKKENPMSLTVKIWRELFLQKCKSETTAIGVGAISVATEYIVPDIYPHIISCIENHTEFGRDESFFFRLHVECDVKHAEEAIEVAKYLCDDPVNREAIRFGVFSALNLRNSFWDNQLARTMI